MNIPLSPEIQQALSQAAQQQGTTPELLAESYVRACLPNTPAAESKPSSAKNLIEALGDFVGCISTGPAGANLSQDTGKKFTELLMRKQREREQGH